MATQNSDNSGTDNTDSEEVLRKKQKQIRLRRCDSTTKVETIVTENEKQRRAQPDKPIHKPRDSILSLGSGFNKYEGLINWGGLLSFLGGMRLTLENFNKYGNRINPIDWIFLFFGHIFENYEAGEYPILFLTLYMNVPFLTALFIERITSTKWISWHMCRTFHWINMITVLLLPVYVINFKYAYIGPVVASLACPLYACIFLKLWSYVQVNRWCRISAFNRPRNLAKQARHPSLLNLNAPNLFAATTSKFRSRTLSNRDTSGNELVQYPDNLSLKDIYYFWLAPTLCYELNFPRSVRIRKIFLLRRASEVVVLINIMLALGQQWIIPSVVNSLIPFSNMEPSQALERILKLALPNHLIWLSFFYLLFHSMLNTLGEIMGFADRNFYDDWWNADDLFEFWKLWNLPVHRWAVRHLFKPMLYRGYSKLTVSVTVFLVSALLHEYLISVPLNMFKSYAFLGMLGQIPLMIISQQAKYIIGKRAGNLVVWMSLILGQPIALMMYYHDFVVANYGKELIASFGTMNKSNHTT